MMKRLMGLVVAEIAIAAVAVAVAVAVGRRVGGEVVVVEVILDSNSEQNWDWSEEGGEVWNLGCSIVEVGMRTKYHGKVQWLAQRR